MLTQTRPGPAPAATTGGGRVVDLASSTGAGVGVIRFKLIQGLLAAVGDAEVISAEGEALDAAGFCVDLLSLAGGGDGMVPDDGVADATTVFRAAFAGGGDTVPIGVGPATRTLRLRCGAGDTAALLVGVGLSAPAVFFCARYLAGEGDIEGVGVWAIANEAPIIAMNTVN